MTRREHRGPQAQLFLLKPSQTGLAKELERLRGIKGQSVHQQARDAGVSPAVLIDIRRDDYGAVSVKPEQQPAKEKQEIGWAQSLTRLTIYANKRLASEHQPELSIVDVLKEFGLDASKPAIERVITYVQGQAGQHGLINDPVLRQVALRRNTVSTGILQWPPFYRDSDSSPKASWAWTYSHRLLGSINPIEWHLNDPIRVEEIDEAVDSLGAGSSKYDLVFGIYDTPYRRLRGLNFLHLPGLAIPLALVHRKDRTIEWETLVRDSAARADMKAIVLRGEVGHLFLAGPCQFPEVEVADTFKIEELIERYVPILKRDSPTFFLCADRTMCRRFLDATRKFVDRDQTLAAVELKLSERNAKWPPNYRLGFAMRADADRWLALLKDTQVEELFRNAINQTAMNYAALLAQAKEDLELIPLTPDLPERIAEQFAVLCRKELKRLMDDAKPEQAAHLDYYVKRIESVWLEPTGAAGDNSEAASPVSLRLTRQT